MCWACQGLLAAEFWMDHVAGVLKMPTEQLREINMFREGEETHFTQILEKCQVGHRPADELSRFPPRW